MYILTKLLRDFMKQVNQHIGNRIRNFRKMKKLTIQQLADMIHKSRATVSKYETGEITLDIETLYDISSALDVDLNQLTDYRPPKEETPAEIVDYSGKSPFFYAEKLCDKIAIIKKGKIRAAATVAALEKNKIELEQFYLDTIYAEEDAPLVSIEGDDILCLNSPAECVAENSSLVGVAEA